MNHTTHHTENEFDSSVVEDGGVVYEATTSQKNKALKLAFSLYEVGRKRERLDKDDGSFFDLQHQLLMTIYEIQHVTLQAERDRLREAIQAMKDAYCKEDVFLENNKPYDWHGYSHATRDILALLSNTPEHD